MPLHNGSMLLVSDDPSLGDDVVIRPAVAAFALAMEAKLRKNDHKGGWDDEAIDWLIGRIKDETKELECAVSDHEKPTRRNATDPNWWPLAARRVLEEAADVANFAMMVADRCDALK